MPTIFVLEKIVRFNIKEVKLIQNYKKILFKICI